MNLLPQSMLIEEPAIDDPTHTAQNLLRANPRTNDSSRMPRDDLSDWYSTATLYSCAQYNHDKANPFVITFKLDNVYMIDTVLLIGGYESHMLIGGFEVYIGSDSDYSNN